MTHTDVDTLRNFSHMIRAWLWLFSVYKFATQLLLYTIQLSLPCCITTPLDYGLVTGMS